MNADIGGDFQLESPQDSRRHAGKHHHAGGIDLSGFLEREPTLFASQRPNRRWMGGKSALHDIAAGVSALIEQSYNPNAAQVIIDNAVDVAAQELSKKSGTPYLFASVIVERKIKPKLDSVREKINDNIKED